MSAKLLARERAPQGIMSWRAPSPHHSGYLQRQAKTQDTELVERGAIVAIRRKQQARTLSTRRLRARRGLRSVAAHCAGARARLRRLVAAAKAREPRKLLHACRIGGQGMGLLIRNHLQSVLYPSQEAYAEPRSLCAWASIQPP